MRIAAVLLALLLGIAISSPPAVIAGGSQRCVGVSVVSPSDSTANRQRSANFAVSDIVDLSFEIEIGGELSGDDHCRAGRLDEMTEAKLWRNPCWLTYRLNYLALRYNVPLYSWVERVYGLSRPEFVVIFSLGLKDGAVARDIAISSGCPTRRSGCFQTVHPMAGKRRPITLVRIE